ncbi:MAG: hypothetical protein QW735_02470 [archaeon]
MADELKTVPNQPVEPEEEVGEKEAESLVFPNAVIVRELRKHISKEKLIKKEVKIAVNKFLAEILAQIAKEMDKFPYATIDYRMFEESIKPFKQAKEIKLEKTRLIKHLDAIIEDCNSIKRDLEEKFKESLE